MAGLYVHIPFCQSRCGYCDFHTSTNLSNTALLIDSIIRELEQGKDFISGEPISTIYLGGGTPSLLSAQKLQQLFEAIFKNLKVDTDAEITLEANPDDLSLQKLKELKHLPVNRLSIGIQSFDDKELKLMNRRHSAAESESAIHRAYDAGFNNLTIDLIYGIPGQAKKTWQSSLDKALQLPVQHLSAYSLTYEKGTPFYKKVAEKKMLPADDEKVLTFFELLMDSTFKAGFEHYEISNFAKPGFKSCHNSSYWSGEKYWGLGPSAHSYNGLVRQWNIADNLKYINAIKYNLPYFETEQLTASDRFNDYVITRIRTMQGVRMADLERDFDPVFVQSFIKEADKFINTKKLMIEGGHLKLTKEGIFISDYIIQSLIVV